MYKLKPIGLAGVARSGKDAFCNSAVQFLAKKGLTCTRKAFADKLKKDLLSVCIQNAGISPFTGDPEEKEIIRPLLVAYGTHVMRRLDPDWWVNEMRKDLEICEELRIIPVITDVRYPNEMDFIQNELGGKCIHISKTGIKAANKEEKENNPLLRANADYRIRWDHYNEDKEKKIHQRAWRIMRKLHKSYLLQ